ncbi:mandelate racemase/muconate lactonizing enzyme family protein [Thiosulfatihalobacter marinus]|uniref:mandelate racemase/muconate lactonizing enzyme family protein n=1 Tax=Thiosulfatihalobacter marinus TaxID=2792481 RepID=UPI0018D8AB9A|nr:mandelate racemase/muconate lactonizing enzyme family protein [Thiosulfatihalobacter marinus]
MRIKSVHHAMVRVPFKETIEWGSGTRIGTTRLVCKIETEDGITGWGETLCLIDAVPAVFEKLVAPMAVGYDISQVERFWRNVLGAGYYHHKRAAVMAAAAMEMAMWDALGKRADLPLYALWGGAFRDKIEAAAYLFSADTDTLRDRLTGFLDAGYLTFKVKIGFDAASDITLAEIARETIGAATLRLDVNGAWTPGTAKRQMSRLAPFDPAYVEQPLELDDLQGHAYLRQWSPVPIALDESAYTLQDVGNILRAKAADVLLLDPHQAGGLWQARKAAGAAEAASLPVGLHSGAELGPSQAAYLHLAAATPNLSIAIDTESVYLSADICRNPPKISDGHFALPEGPGLGVEVDEDLLEHYHVTSIDGAYLNPARPGWFPLKPSY